MAWTARTFPLFVQAGIDTTVAVPTALGDPTADTTMVPVYNYAVSRGECSDFESSANPDIASNYGVDCQGIRVPVLGPLDLSAHRQAELLLRHRFPAGVYRSHQPVPGPHLPGESGRPRPAPDLRIALQPARTCPAFRNYSKVFTLNWTQNLTRSTERALALETYLSYQQDRTLQWSDDPEGELGSRNPFGGFMIGPMDFLFNFDNFPLDDRAAATTSGSNVAGSRRSPLRPREPGAVRHRSTSGGTTPTASTTGMSSPRCIVPRVGWPGRQRSGSPDRQVLYKENRLIGKANLDWQFDRYNRVKLGGEFTHYDIDSYSHQLESQAFSDFYLEKPIRYNLFAEDRLDLGDVVVVGGVRYDCYDTRARRWNNFPRISTNPLFDPNNPDAFFTNDSLFPKDQSHDYLSPHIQVSFPVTERTNFRLSYAHQVQAPDFGVVLQGINTDLATTNTNNFYGADLDFGRTITFEFGVRHAFSDDMVLDVAAYNRDNLSNAAGPSGVPVRSASGQQPEHPDHDQCRLREHPRR